MNNHKTLIRFGKIITPFYTIRDGIIAIDNEGKIAYVGTPKQRFLKHKDVIDLREKIAVPGFIDIHIHGVVGADTMDGRYDSLVKISEFLASKGVTSFLPTTVTAPLEDIYKALDAIREAKEKGTGYSKVIGGHLEGPYLNVEKAGAQDKRYIRNPVIKEIKSLVENYKNVLIRITLAPEIEGAIEVIKYLSKNGIVVSLGHTNATYDVTIEAIDAGAKVANHLFNAMRNFHHRDPGVIGAFLTRDDVYVELIIDEIHHHDAARKLAIKCKGTDKVALVSDSIAATGLEDGEYMLGKQKIIVKDGISRLPDGTLAGSTVTLDKSIKHVVERLDISLNEAVKMATYVPARIMGIGDSIGMLRTGYIADITVLNLDLSVYMTIISGEIVYSSEKTDLSQG